ncbi:TPA: AAA family ATPase, partial [Legionella pneumophila]|uniref:AAA family ATPase n=1 Tax=Legionella pneumophila TaxID=446 RepID=UPI0010E9D3F3
QLQAIEAGAPFRAIAETHQYVELNQIRRQTTPWQVNASLDLAQGAVGKALDAYREHDHVHQFKFSQEAKEQLINLWNDARMANRNESQIILSFTREDVNELNSLAREKKRKDKELGEDVVFRMERGVRHFAVNDRVYFLKREDSISVVNGTLGTISSIDEQSGVIGVELDSDDLHQKPRVVSVNTEHYKHMEHGYAATVYKAQGVTVDRSYVLPSKHYDAHSTYVAMTRHRKSCDVFVSREAFANDKVLVETLGRNRAKELTMDYTKMDNEFARLRSVIAGTELPKESSFAVRRLEQGEKDKLKAFTKEALSLRHAGSLKESGLRHDFHAFKKQFEQRNPGLSQKLRQEILPTKENEYLVNNKETMKQKEGFSIKQESGVKQKVHERELELER